jgi:hypothetical protein
MDSIVVLYLTANNCPLSNNRYHPQRIQGCRSMKICVQYYAPIIDDDSARLLRGDSSSVVRELGNTGGKGLTTASYFAKLRGSFIRID